MKLPTHDINGIDHERKRRRRTGATINNNNDSGCDVVNGSCDDPEIRRKERVANFVHHKRVADYLLGKSVGEGSFAKVRLGLHVQTGEEVAVKVMSKARARKDSYVHKNLRREGRILQLARHRNIVQVFDILETDNNYYLVTEFCKGGELIDIVTEKGSLPEHDVRGYITQLASAVSHLHDHGIVHRDLKVENLLLSDRGDLKIIDFGLSNLISSKCMDPTRALSTQCGSPAYAAPELLAKNLYGPKVDVWSIGIITYALLVGKLPFTVEPFRIPKLCRKMLLGDMNPIPSFLSGNCRHFIKRLLIPDPDIRPTITQVMKMTWISTTARPSSKGGKSGLKNDDMHTSSDINTEVIREMTSKLEFEFADVLNCVRKNRPGEALATYYLLLKQKLHHREELRQNDVIGSDGNLDHGNESDVKSSDDEEEGQNDIDDVNGGVIFDNVFAKDRLYKSPVEAFEKKYRGSNGSGPLNGGNAVDRPVRTPSVRKSAIKYHVSDLQPGSKPEKKSPVNIQPEVLKRKKSEIGKDVPNEDGECHPREGNLPDVEELPTDAGKSQSKLPHLEASPAHKSSSKPERKSRGPSSMRDLVKTMSRARQALQKRGKFGQSKGGHVEEKKASDSGEFGKFRRLLSKNSDDNGEKHTAKVKESDNSPTLHKKWDHRSPHLSRNLWKNYLTPGEAAALSPNPHVLPETTAHSTPLSLRVPFVRQWRDGRPVVPSTGYSSEAHSPLVAYHHRTTTPHRISSFRASIDSSDHATTEMANTLLPRISMDRSSHVSDLVSNPIGISNPSTRYHFPSPPRTPMSRETTPTVGNGVKDMIDKFHSLLKDDASPKRGTKSQTKYDRSSSRDPESTSAAMAYLSSTRRKREEIRNNMSPQKDYQFLPTSSQNLPRTPSPNSGSLHPASSSNLAGYVIKQPERTFTSHFGREQKTFENGVHSYLPKRLRTPNGTPEFNASGAIWYKSAV